jgi:multidrug resistance efflux pump
VQQQRELSLLKIEQAKLQHNLAGLETAIREEIDLVENFRRMQEKRVEQGVETRDSILTLQRELLRLERELAVASSARDASSYRVQDEKRKLEESHQSDESHKVQSEIESMLARGLGQSHPAIKAMRDRLQQLTVSAKANAESGARPERRRELAISAPKPGIVQQVVVREGAKVKAGERLLVFDDRQAKVKLQTARAQLEAAKAVLKLGEIALQGAGAELERVKEITAARLASQAELASKQRAYESAQASLAKSNAEAGVVEQQLRQAEIELEMLTILSPKNGTILQVNILEGEHTSPANDPLIVIGD